MCSETVRSSLDRLGEARPFLVRELAGPQVALVHAADRAHDTHGQLGGAHFHRKDGHGKAFVERHVLGNVHGERGLAHRRARGQHDHVARLQSRGHAVQVGEAGGDPGHVHRVVRHLLHLVQQVHHEGVERLEALLVARALFADGEDLGFGLVQDLLDRLSLRIEGRRGDFVARRDELAQDGALAHDLRVAADVGGAGNVLRQIVEIGQPAHLLGLAQALQLAEDRDHVRRLAGIHQLADGRIDELVLVPVEIPVHQQVTHPVPGHVVEQQAAQHAGLGLQRMRWHAQPGHLLVRRGGRREIGFVQRREVGTHGNRSLRFRHHSGAGNCRSVDKSVEKPFTAGGLAVHGCGARKRKSRLGRRLLPGGKAAPAFLPIRRFRRTRTR